MAGGRIHLDPDECVALVSSGRWLTKVQTEGSCSEWTGVRNSGGYGHIKMRGIRVAVHRVAWVAANGCDIPDDLTIDHLCRNRSCVNPQHLEAVTVFVNVRRGRDLITECPRGHALTPDNLVPASLKRSERTCLECHRAMNRERGRLVSEAARALGLGRREYIAQHGQSRSVAEELLKAVS